MVGMAMGNHGALDGPHRIDVEAAGLAAQTGGNGYQDVLRAHLGYIVRRKVHSSLLPPKSCPAKSCPVKVSSRPVLPPACLFDPPLVPPCLHEYSCPPAI